MIFHKWKLLFAIFLAIFLRFTFRYSSYYNEISKRVEVSSPVSSWIRVIEGVKLKQLNIQPYDHGQTFHESPIFLSFYQFLLNNFNDLQITLIFILFDIMTSFILSKISIIQLNLLKYEDDKRMKKYLSSNQNEDDKKIFKNLLINFESIKNNSEWTQYIYLLSPYSILPCVAQSTQVMQNFLISLIILLSLYRLRIQTLILLSLLVINTFYSIILLLPIILIMEKKNIVEKNDDKNNDNKNDDNKKIISSLILFIIVTIILLSITIYIENGSLKFLQSTILFMFRYEDLQPNIGLFWYFFAEMFEHFYTFFLWIFQLNYFIYIIPLSIKLNNNPYFLLLILLINHSIFKPYPTISDFILYLSLLPQWNHLFEYMKSTLIVSGTIVTTSILAPILWYLWIVLSTANSNFYFGITLAYNIAQIFLLTDLIFAHIKREYYFNNLDLYLICKKTKKSPRIELSYN